MPRSLLVLCVALVVTSAVNAQTPYYHKVESLDWMAADSAVIVRAVVTDFVHEADRSKQSTVSINVLETLKGPHKTTHTFNVPWLDREELLRWKTKKPEMLVFLVDSKRYSDQASMHRWTPRFAMNGQDKDNPNIHSPKEWGLIELAAKVSRPNGGLTTVYTLDMRDSSDPKEVLAATRAAIAAAKVKQARSHEFRWPRGLGNIDRKVLVDERLERLARTWIESNNPAWRYEGARALAHFKSDENVAALKRLLKDNLALRHSRVKVEKQKTAVSFMEVFLSFPWGPANEDRHSRQQVSDAALASLTTLGVAVRMPEMRPPPVVLCKATLDGPKEALVDQEITFQLRIVNTSDRTTSKHACLHVYAFSHDPWKLRTVQAIPLEPLAASQARNIPLKLTPVRMGTFDVRVYLESTLETEADISCGELARSEAQVGYDPKATVQDLLLASPKLQPTTPRLPATLAEVTEISLQEAPANSVAADDVREHLARTIDRIKWFDQRKPDGFMHGLVSQRADLAGIPFALGEACRHKGEKREAFVATMEVLRESRSGGLSVDKFLNTPSKKKVVHSNAGVQARTAALMQTLAHEDPGSVVKYLAGVPDVDATTALAKFAIFSEEAPVRQAALTALKSRPAKDYADVLRMGLDYPWPAVAERASAAIAKLQRIDLIPQLIDVLDRPDPRAPQMRDKVPVVRELVRINHHRNCLLCHATGNLAASETPTAPHAVAPLLAADVLIPNQAFPQTYYSQQERSLDIFVRIDVTYLRQDFSMLLPVKDAYPWPEKQRFDFVVRTRQLSEKDAQAYREKMTPGMSPYHLAAVRALRDLTGRNTEPTAQAWRKLLAL